MTTPGLRWPDPTASGGHVWRYDPITCSPLWPPRQGERQGQGRGDRRLLPPELPGADQGGDLDTHLEACCARWAEQLRGHDQTAWNGIRSAPCNRLRRLRQAPGAGHGALSRHRTVPTRFGHCEVLVYVHEVVITEVIARTRAYGKRTSSSIRCTICPCWSKRPTRWIRRLPWPWLLPPVFGDLRRARMGNRLRAGKRESVQVLRCRELLPRDVRIGGAGARRDRLRPAVKHLYGAGTLEPAAPWLLSAYPRARW